MTKTIVPIVEGHGETTAIPVLLRKLLHEHFDVHDVNVDKPIRRTRSELVDPDQLARWVQIAAGTPECIGVVIILDSDNDCPAKLGPQLAEFASAKTDVPVCVVLAVREFEAWLLASADSIKGKAGLVEHLELPPDGPESKRDAKGWISRNMADKPYAETIHQAKITAWLDVQLASQNSRSFRKLVGDMGDLIRSAR